MWCSCEKVGNDEKIPTTQCARYLHPVAQNAENGVTDPRNKKKLFQTVGAPELQRGGATRKEIKNIHVSIPGQMDVYLCMPDLNVSK
jgi:hypothetical protein